MAQPSTPKPIVPEAPPRTVPFLPAVENGAAPGVPVKPDVAQNVRGGASHEPAPMPPPFRSPSPQHAGGSLSIPEGPAREVAERMGSLGQLAFGKQSAPEQTHTQVASIGDIVSHSRRLTNY